MTACQVVALQFFSEGFSSLLLLLVSFHENAESDGMQEMADTLTFYLLLGPVFYPVLQKVTRERL